MKERRAKVAAAAAAAAAAAGEEEEEEEEEESKLDFPFPFWPDAERAICFVGRLYWQEKLMLVEVTLLLNFCEIEA